MVPGAEGVRVTTTASRLIKAIEAWLATAAAYSFALGRVSYLPKSSPAQVVANLVESHGLKYLNTLDGRARTLLLKRDYFRHEDEVRLICVGANKQTASETIRYFPIAPNDIFTEIAFDPQLVAFERMEREKTARQLGYVGEIVHDTNYQKTFHQIIMKNGWRD